LQNRGVEFDTVEYLKTPLSRETLAEIIAMLDVPVAEFVRKDKRFEELGLKPADYIEKNAVIELLGTYPELMQRPIVIRNGRAVIARPAERLEKLF